MGAHAGSGGGSRGRAGRHRRTGQALVERRDHTDGDRPRRLALPSPSPSALVGIAVLVLIAVGVIHLSGAGSAVPLETPPVTAAETSAETPRETAGDPSDGGGDGEDGEDGGDTASSAAPSGPAELLVHVSGAVATPGVVRLPAGARVDDALRAADGASEDAELSAVNLARPVADGEQIHVPRPGEEPPVPAAGSPDDAGATGEPADDTGADGGPIDLNSASAAELEELPGVGPAIAQRIVEHREKNGPFASVDDLLEVSGIGPATLEEIRAQAAV
ncbi:ComEA family DNA-binding protein [Brachybacterium sacelli]|uniref:Competence protein ComEA n=1 Tax=Brachybacterium sacelli TaxID=173364 RepID=A0ABS4X6S5_9MICO|nr:ComEA family DNA-binding protein [Brachybacterium sacelli]MBP2384155.1 competence protein ComEA [Brachybacterium sacelli]